MELIATHNIPHLDDPTAQLTSEYLPIIKDFYQLGSRNVRIYGGIHLWKKSQVPYSKSPIRLDSPERFEVMELASSLGMGFHIHVADPDSYFSKMYPDSEKFGRKEDHLEALEKVLETFKRPTIVSHFGGNPENLNYLDLMFTRYPFLFINTSATKWVVRELSKHNLDHVRSFFIKWRKRIIMGTDVVTTDNHLSQDKSNAHTIKAQQSSSGEEAIRLYASRLWVQRLFLETNEIRRSPIKDPDLKHENEDYQDGDSPMINCLSLPHDVLADIYWKNISNFRLSL